MTKTLSVFKMSLLFEYSRRSLKIHSFKTNSVKGVIICDERSGDCAS